MIAMVDPKAVPVARARIRARATQARSLKSAAAFSNGPYASGEVEEGGCSSLERTAVERLDAVFARDLLQGRTATAGEL